MNRYEHKQIGYLILVAFLLTTSLFAYIYVISEKEPVILFFALLILLVVGSFSSLTVTIDETHLRLRFGYGIFTKAFKLSDIESAQSVRNHWYYGWGIRVWPWPYMWIYCVSGLDAVEVRMKNGRIFRVGTDEPQKLESALTQAL